MAHPSHAGPAPVAGLIAAGREALLAGEKVRARALLQAAVRTDPESVEAWLWLSGTFSAPDDIAACLHRVLEIDPANVQAQEGMAWLVQTYAPAPPADIASRTLATDQQSLLPDAPVQPDEHTSAPQMIGSDEGLKTGAATPGSVTYLADEGVIDAGETSTFALPDQVTTPRTAARLDTTDGASSVVEAALHVVAIGGLLGLLRLIGILRPGTLLLVRGGDGPINLFPALGLALLTAALHGAALLVGWAVLSRSISRVRNDRRGDQYDSLLRTRQVLMPGYLTGGALLVASLGLGWSERRWIPLVFGIWALLLLSTWLIGRRLHRLLDLTRIGGEQRIVSLVRVMLPALVTTTVGLGLAGIVIRTLLRVL